MSNFPMSVYRMIEMATDEKCKGGKWGFVALKTKEGKSTNKPLKGNCPRCKDRLIAGGKSITLATRGSLSLVKFFRESEIKYVCNVCGYRAIKHTTTSPTTPPPPSVPVCGCGAPLPSERKRFCLACRPATQKVACPPF